MVSRGSYQERINTTALKLDETRKLLYSLNNKGKLSASKARELENAIATLGVELSEAKKALELAEKTGVFAEMDLEILKLKTEIERLKLKDQNSQTIQALLDDLKDLT